jgi:outer membrane protein assembly factor BamB
MHTNLRQFVGAACCLMAVVATLVVSPTQMAAAAGGTAKAPAHVWPEFHGGPQLSGTNGDGSISTGNAATLGVRWMSPIGSSLDSPAAVWDAGLGLALTYEGGAAGYFNAVNVATGQIVWSDYLGAAVTSSPLTENGNVWIAPAGTGRIYKLNESTGATECSGTVADSVLSSPVFASPPGGVPTV